ncbi:DUF6622 family protein [Burkholderia seminalis]|uniref:DUF6622 family protein n=2 Tax=Burkholderia TaxID=32008 RepID=UPI00299D6C81|nr:DUF6622 family protein [Burkholderia seminalis]
MSRSVARRDSGWRRLRVERASPDDHRHDAQLVRGFRPPVASRAARRGCAVRCRRVHSDQATSTMSALLHLKPYVYVMFCVLLYIGIKRCFPREVPAMRPLISPVVFGMLGIVSLNGLFPHAGVDANAIALAAVLGGASLGWLHASRWRLEYRSMPSGLHVRLPGDASLLVTLMVTFVAETCMHYAVAVRAPWAATSGFEMLSFAVWGVLVGMTLGRALNVVVRCMRHASGSERGGYPYSVDSR